MVLDAKDEGLFLNTRVSGWNLVTIGSKLVYFTYLGDVSNLLIGCYRDYNPVRNVPTECSSQIFQLFERISANKMHIEH